MQVGRARVDVCPRLLRCRVILTRFLLEFDLRVNYSIVALEDIYKSSTHGSSNSTCSLRYSHFSEVAQAFQLHIRTTHALPLVLLL